MNNIQKNTNKNQPKEEEKNIYWNKIGGKQTGSCHQHDIQEGKRKGLKLKQE